MKARFIHTVLETLLSGRRSVLWLVQRHRGGERIKVSVKNLFNFVQSFSKKPTKFWEFVEIAWRVIDLLTYKLRIFWMAFTFFSFCLTLSVPEKLENSIFEMPIITQNLIINNLRTTSAKSTNLHTMKNLVGYSLKGVVAKAMFILTVLEILLLESRSVLWRTQWSTGRKTVT